uniref:HTH cro/C1-type domain-containing protein n=1 Tax=Streptomyces sp. FR1 TaxID=349971 RepID=V9Z0P3_9ACTN|nr:helix-turn-helix transcriptional regulator [Streptomyces sp. FR1]AHE39150.1 Hypothetical protein pFRL3_373 [Streptomyces sp. FR1]
MSRYNSGIVCTSCQRGTWIPAHLWDHPDLQQALAAFDFGLVLRTIRRLTGMSQSDVAAHTGLDQGEISRLEAGSRRLKSIDKIIPFLESLGVPRELSPIRTPGTTDVLPLHVEPEWDDPVDVAAALNELLATNTAFAALETAETALARIVDLYELDGPTGMSRLAAKTRKLRSHLQGLLRGQQPPSHRAALFRITARTSAVLGYMAVNAGRHHLAESYCAEAVGLAGDIGDLETVMWAYGTRSLSAYYRGDFEEAVRWADTGIALAPLHPQAIRLQVNGRARALSRMKDSDGAIRAIETAEDLSARHSVTTQLTPCISLEPYGVTRTLANAITAYVGLGDTAEVRRYADEISDHVATAESDWTRSLVRLDEATAHVSGSQPDLEHAMLLGRQVLQDAEDGPLILSVVQRAHELRHTAQNWKNTPAVRDYTEALGVWSESPRVRELVSSVTMPVQAHASGRTASRDGFSTDHASGRVPGEPSLRS